MQQAIIDCRTGKISYVELLPSEETKHLQGIEERQEQERVEKESELKRLLVRELAELREMKLNPLLFTVDDIAGKQAEVDRLQGSRGR